MSQLYQFIQEYLFTPFGMFFPMVIIFVANVVCSLLSGRVFRKLESKIPKRTQFLLMVSAPFPTWGSINSKFRDKNWYPLLRTIERSRWVINILIAAYFIFIYVVSKYEFERLSIS